MRRVKKRVAELDLTTDHFKGQRTWTDSDLRVAISESSNWTEVAQLLGLSSFSTSDRLRAHAGRLNLDVSHLPPYGRPKDFDWPAPRQEMLRFAAEPLAVAWFTLHGLPVAQPLQPSAFDLLVTFTDGVRRVQVKSSTAKGRYGSWVVGIGRRPYVLDKSAGRIPYGPDELDYFFIVDGDGMFYLIPSAVLTDRVVICVGPYKGFIVGCAGSLVCPVPNETPARTAEM